VRESLVFTAKAQKREGSRRKAKDKNCQSKNCKRCVGRLSAILPRRRKNAKVREEKLKTRIAKARTAKDVLVDYQLFYREDAKARRFAKKRQQI